MIPPNSDSAQSLWVNRVPLNVLQAFPKFT